MFDQIWAKKCRNVGPLFALRSLWSTILVYVTINYIIICLLCIFVRLCLVKICKIYFKKYTFRVIWPLYILGLCLLTFYRNKKAESIMTSQKLKG